MASCLFWGVVFILSIGVLWNSVQSFKEECINDILKNAEILGIYDLNLNEQFECFVRDVYKPDESIAKWKIDKKIETLNYYENKSVTILFLNIDVSKKVYHKGKKRNVYISAERLKNLLRNKYSKKIPNYFPDNIFHMTDDEKEFKELYPIVVSYLDDYNTEKDGNKKRVRRCNRYEV